MKAFVKGLHNERGVLLISSFLVIMVLGIIGYVFSSQSITQIKSANISKLSQQAFCIADAGIDYGYYQIRSGAGSGSHSSYLSGIGQYDVSWAMIDDTQYRITSQGSAGNTSRNVEVILKKQELDASFFTQALYASGDVTISGVSYDVTGDVYYGGSISGDTSNIDGDVVQDPSINPLTQLNYEQLYTMAETQGNVYDEDRIKDVETSKDSYPASFWFNEAAGTPNVVYVEGDLKMSGNVGNVGGFFVVVGNVLSEPEDTGETVISGSAEIDGCIYTTGEFDVKGGGQGINVDGGVWTGSDAKLNGSIDITYNATYMNAIKDLDLNTEYVFWTWEQIY